jgi:hypothetical protein
LEKNKKGMEVILIWEMLKILPSSSLCPPLLLKKIDFKQKGVSDVIINGG